jgi:hypothetical protein
MTPLGERLAHGAALAAAVGLVLAAAGCGEREEPEPTTTTPVEQAEKVPKLPDRWKVLRVPDQGFALGQPPGWHKGRQCLAKKTSPGTTTVLCSPDRLLTLSISADRSAEALEITPEEFAARVMARLSENYQKPLDPGKPKPFKAHYDGAQVNATGKAAKGIREDVRVIVMRRDDVAVFTAVIAKHASKATGTHTKFAERALKSLRSRPVG